MTANVVREYKVSSVRDATVIAASWRSLFSEWMRTKKTMREMMVKTMTKMPLKRPLLALEQSTEYLKLKEKILSSLEKGRTFLFSNLVPGHFLRVGRYGEMHPKGDLVPPPALLVVVVLLHDILPHHV